MCPCRYDISEGVDLFDDDPDYAAPLRSQAMTERFLGALIDDPHITDFPSSEMAVLGGRSGCRLRSPFCYPF